MLVDWNLLREQADLAGGFDNLLMFDFDRLRHVQQLQIEFRIKPRPDHAQPAGCYRFDEWLAQDVK